ncbi:hypothetical protein OIN81_17870 [Acinetobacter baumannii]|nr:hypothetical protein [Acinetobacter baumannii]
MLFRNFIRTDHNVIQANESEFTFLERCAWPKVENIRLLLQECFKNYPDTEKDDIIARLKSGDSRHFASSTFELFLHEYLFRQGCVLLPHPELPNGSLKRPDFLVSLPDGQQFYLEAVCATEDIGKNDSTEALKDWALEYVNSRPHQNFVLSIDSFGESITQPSGKKLYGVIKSWLDSLDPEIVLAECNINGYSSLPEINWSHEGWEITIQAIPLEAEYRGTHDQLIGIRGHGATWIDSWTPIRKAIQKKTDRYGQLDLPLVVAVNVRSFRLQLTDEMQALFGGEKLTFNLGDLNSPNFCKHTDGAWLGPTGPRGRKCSGAWLFENISPYNLANVKHSLYVNPWAYKPLPNSAFIMPNRHVYESGVKLIVGSSFKEIFNLSPNWPELE